MKIFLTALGDWHIDKYQHHELYITWHVLCPSDGHIPGPGGWSGQPPSERAWGAGDWLPHPGRHPRHGLQLPGDHGDDQDDVTWETMMLPGQSVWRLLCWPQPGVSGISRVCHWPRGWDHSGACELPLPQRDHLQSGGVYLRVVVSVISSAISVISVWEMTDDHWPSPGVISVTLMVMSFIWE